MTYSMKPTSLSASAADKIAHLEARSQRGARAGVLHIDDDSAAHAGHAGAASGSHFTVTIVSGQFAGKPRVARHRIV